LKAEKFYKNDKPEGKWTEWYKEGKKKNERYYNNGQLNGLWTE